MLVALLLTAIVSADEIPDRPPTDPGCVAETYELEISEYLRFGDIFERAQRHCATVNIPDAPPYPGRMYIIGRTRLARFRLFGEEFGLNLNLINRSPGPLGTAGGFSGEEFGANRGIGGNDLLYVAPSLDLPDSWDRAIDAAAGPVALIGGVALTTAILIGIFGN